MTATDLIRVLWRRKLVLLLTLVVVVGSGTWWTLSQPPRYDAGVVLALFPDMDEPASLPLYTTTVDSVLPAYYPLLQSRVFLDGVAAELEGDVTGAELAGSVWVQPQGSRAVFRIAARSADPERAVEVARATASAFIAEFAGEQVGQLRVLDDARTPTSPATPRTALIFPALLLAGLLLAGGVALLFDRLFGRVGDSAGLAAAIDAPVLGVVPRARSLTGGRRIVLGTQEEGLRGLERSLRALRTNVMFALEKQPEGPIVVTSLKAGEGKSTVAANLAAFTAALGYDVLLVDADIHRPVIHEYFPDVDPNRGLTSCALDGALIEDLPQPVGDDALRVIPRGRPMPAHSREVGTYFHELPKTAKLADFSFVDTPPLRAGDEVRLLSASSAGVLLVVRAGACGAHELRSAVASLRRLGVNILGAILTQATERPEMGGSLDYEYYAAPTAELDGVPAAPAPSPEAR
jgi:capsular exopolysaccharide synthesis family protein